MGWSFDDLYYVLHLGKGSLREINRAWQVLPANGKKVLFGEQETRSLGRLLGRVVDLFGVSIENRHLLFHSVPLIHLSQIVRLTMFHKPEVHVQSQIPEPIMRSGATFCSHHGACESRWSLRSHLLLYHEARGGSIVSVGGAIHNDFVGNFAYLSNTEPLPCW